MVRYVMSRCNPPGIFSILMLLRKDALVKLWWAQIIYPSVLSEYKTLT